MPIVPGTRLGGQLNGVDRCPHCGVAAPLLKQRWISDRPIPRDDGMPSSIWGAFACTSCGSIVTAKGLPGENSSTALILDIFPDQKAVSSDLPDRVRRYLEQAYTALPAPDAAAMVAGSAVDAMLKEMGYAEGSVYKRIDQAVSDGILTEQMGKWAHQVRLGSNRPRHADAEDPHVSPEEAKQSIEFADALGTFLFVLSARIERGIQSTTSSGD